MSDNQQRHRLMTFPIPLYPVVGNLDFAPCIANDRCRIIKERGLDLVTKWKENGVHSIPYWDPRLKELGIFGVPQICSFFKSLPPPVMFLRGKTTLQEECEKKGRRYALSKMYNILSKARTGDVSTLTYFDKWENDLNI